MADIPSGEITLTHIAMMVARVDEKLDNLHANLNAHKAEDVEYYEKVEKLERKHIRSTGFIAGISASVSAIVTAVGLWFTYKGN